MPKIPNLITYCSNIHPGESWSEVFSALREHIPAVKAAVSPNQPFPIGLRLPSHAAGTLTVAENSQFSDWLRDNDCFVSTINGFPFGSFHSRPVKQRVYLPDWRSPERTAYTLRLADLLVDWLPSGGGGSISTVPLGFKGMVHMDDLPRMQGQLVSVLTHLDRLRQKQGKEIILALEPEPGCLLETTDDVCHFFEKVDLPSELRDLLGICYDCCHQAVEYEEPGRSLDRLVQAGIRVAKVQASSSPCWIDPGPDQLSDFEEPCYLHQVVIRRRDGLLCRYNDLADALAGHRREKDDEWRCHFHIPIFMESSATCGTTRKFLEDLVPLLPRDMLLEVETYTWSVLPPQLSVGSVTESIIREMKWLEGQVHAAHGRH